MKITSLRLFVFAVVFLFASQVTHSQIPTVSVGGNSIALPPPEGFFRYDGKSARVDAVEQNLLPKTNRLLAVFGLEEVLADVLSDRFPKIGRHFSAQTERSLEVMTISPSLFAEFKPEMRNPITAQLEIYREAAKEIENNAASAAYAQTGILAKLRIGETIPLGIFDETKESLCFSMLSKAQISGIAGSYVTITACCVINVKDRLFYLYSSSPYREKADIEWARRSVQRWRDAVLKSNAQ